MTGSRGTFDTQDFLNQTERITALLVPWCCSVIWLLPGFCSVIYLLPGCFSRCNYILDCKGKPQPFKVEDQENIVKNVIEPMAEDGLRTICLAYKDYHTDPSENHLEDHS